MRLLFILFLTCAFYLSKAQLIINSQTPLPEKYFKLGYGFKHILNTVDDYELEPEKYLGAFCFEYDFNIDINVICGFGLSYSYNKFKSYNNIDYYYNPYNQDIKTMGKYHCIYGSFHFDYLMEFKGNVQPYIGFGLGFLYSEAKYDCAEAIYSNYYHSGQYIIIEKTWKNSTLLPEFKAGLNIFIKRGLGFYCEVGLGETAIETGFVKCFGKNIP